jgi:hypothetical protein
MILIIFEDQVIKVHIRYFFNNLNNHEIAGNWPLSVPIQQISDNEQNTWENDLDKTISKDAGGSFIIEKIISTTSGTAVYVKMNREDIRELVKLVATP